jgi:hypothetical protein
MNFLAYWKEVALAVIVAALIWGGYHIHTLEDYKTQAHDLQIQLQTNAKALDKANIASMKLENDNRSLRLAAQKREADVEIQISKDKIYTDCKHSPAVLKQLQANSVSTN